MSGTEIPCVPRVSAREPTLGSDLGRRSNPPPPTTTYRLLRTTLHQKDGVVCLSLHISVPLCLPYGASTLLRGAMTLQLACANLTITPLCTRQLLLCEEAGVWMGGEWETKDWQWPTLEILRPTPYTLHPLSLSLYLALSLSTSTSLFPTTSQPFRLHSSLSPSLPPALPPSLPLPLSPITSQHILTRVPSQLHLGSKGQTHRTSTQDGPNPIYRRGFRLRVRDRTVDNLRVQVLCCQRMLGDNR
eukprot:220132-Rhodomonas_salina.1